MRIGWAYGPIEVIDVLHRVRGPFNANLPAQAAAVAALGDVAHTDAARTHNDIWLPWLTAEVAKLGIEVPPSIGNFILTRFPGGPKQCAAADRHLRERLIYCRPMAGYGFPEAIRISIGTEAENRAVVDVLTRFLD